jgi:tRNA dimethylallyltransferase
MSPDRGARQGAGDEDHGGAVVAIFGPTAVGKTPVAARVAHTLGVRVVSCDSMQIYRGFPVLTNQPSASVGGATVRHELVGVAAPEEEWTAAQYAERAQALIDEDLARSGWAVISGGTGLYLRAALAPLEMAKPGDPALRAELEELAEREGPYRLHERLAAADPAAAAGIHPHNVRRVVRALEVAAAASGQTWSGRTDLWAPSYRHATLLVGLVAERRLLYERVDRRAWEMVRGGAVEEVRRYRDEALCDRGAVADAEPGLRRGSGRGIERAIGYSEISQHLDGYQSLDEVSAQLAAATRRYVRRQLTWMRKLEDAVIMDVSESDVETTASSIVERALGFRSGATESRVSGSDAHPTDEVSAERERDGRRSDPDAASDPPG